MSEPSFVQAPDAIYRLARSSQLTRFSTISPTDAQLSGAGNRFDVPGGGVIYAATERVACYAETLARFRPTPAMIELAAQDEDTSRMVLGGIPQAWRLDRVMGTFKLEEGALPFLDLQQPETHEWLSQEMRSTLIGLGYDQPLDLADVCGRDRLLSRAIAEFAYTLVDPDEDFMLSGIRYTSRLNSDWECWAVFEGAPLELVDRRPIELHDPDLRRVTGMWALRPF